MSELRKSPERNTFQKEKYLERQAEKGNTPENNEDVAAMLDWYNSWNVQKQKKEEDLEWRKNNMEYDLRTSTYIAEKCKDEYYAQNLYAAMCNNDFVKNDVWPLLTDSRWSCSWRYAGGIIADIRQEGDYIDWYCSGIRGELSDSDKEDMTQEQIDLYNYQSSRFVGESFVTDEIREDLLKLGWIVIEDDSVE